MKVDYAILPEPPQSSNYGAWQQIATLEAQRFCHERAIATDVGNILVLLESCFPTIHSKSIGLVEDPESGSIVAVIKIKVGSSIEQALAEYDTFIEKWVTDPSWRAKDYVCVSYRVE